MTIETGARFLLDPKIKHGPNLMEVSAQGRECRIDFYRRCIDLADELGAPLVSLWSGADLSGIVYSEDGDCGAALERLAEGLEKVLNHAREKQILIGFEPEPGMFIEGPAGYQALLEVLGAQGDDLGLTLDVGHLVVTGDLPERDVIHAFAQHLVHRL